MNAKEKYWSDALERLVKIVKFLASQNLAFRGSFDTSCRKDSFNFDIKGGIPFKHMWT